MRFIADGANLPDELLWAHDKGRVLFMCGAGVSKAKAELPDFDTLTETVLHGLGADESEEAFRLHKAIRAVETASEIKRLLSADYVFQLLEQSFTPTDVASQVAQALTPRPEVDLSAHRTLLALSRGRAGAVRLVTTNFDRLFEQCDRKLATVTRSNLPDPNGGPADWGIVHLHGCVDRAYSGPTEDGFVLSSGSFGDAYLAMGWAREFVKAVLAKHVVVFVGYSADDPPIRYLLQGLQQSNGAPNETYAFQNSSDGAAVAAWKEKGVEPLLYETEAGCGHRALWETLEHWSVRARDPRRWRSRVLARARRGPRALAPHERGMVAHVVSDVEGAAAFAGKQTQLSAEWLCVFDPGIRYGSPNHLAGAAGDGPVIDPFDWYRLDSDPLPRTTQNQLGRPNRVPERAWSALDPSPADFRTISRDQVARIRGSWDVDPPKLPDRINHLARWIARVWERPAAAWWAGGQDTINDTVLDGIRYELEVLPRRKGVLPAVRKAWQTYLDYANLKQPWGGRTRLLELRIQQAGWSEAVADEYAACFAPSLSLDDTGRGPVPPRADSKPASSDLVKVAVEYEYEYQVPRIEVPDDHLQTVIPKLRVQLERAEALEDKYPTFICSIERDDELEGDSSPNRFYKLSGLVVTFAGLFHRLARRSPAAALAELRTWPAQSRFLARIRIWALGNLAIADAGEYAEALLALDRTLFWPIHGETELLLGLSRRWSEMDGALRRRLEQRLRAGPPRPNGRDREEHISPAAHQVLSRLHWLHGQGCDFAFDLDVITAKLRAAAPQWQPGRADRAADGRDGRIGTVRTDTEYSSTGSLPPEDILKYLDYGGYVSRDPLAKLESVLRLREEQPERVIQTLTKDYARGQFGAASWSKFLRGDHLRANNRPGLTVTVFDALLGLSYSDFAQIALSASEWFGQAATGSLFDCEPRCEALWAMFIRVLGRREGTDRPAVTQSDAPAGRTRDWSTEAGNSTAGNLARLAVEALRGNPFKAPDGTAAGSWLPRLDEVLKLPADSRRYALAIVAERLDRFFAIDPEWTTQHVLSVLDEQPETEPDREAFWAGFFLSPSRLAPALFARLKPHLLELTKQAAGPGDRQSVILARMFLEDWRHPQAGGRRISDQQMRAAILNAHETFRHWLIRMLPERFRNDDEREAGQIVDFLSNAWPKQKRIRTPETSAQLCDLAFSRTTDFPEVARTVAKLVTKIEDAPETSILGLHIREQDAAGQHPREVLDLLHAFLPDQRNFWPNGAEFVMRFLRDQHPSICKHPKFIELDGRT